MPYIDLGPRSAKAAADTTGNNTGNWTVTFSPDDFRINVNQFELYRIIITGPAGSTFSVFRDIQEWDQGIRGDANSADLIQPMPLRPGQYLFFYWSAATAARPVPAVTVWLRYDPTIARVMQGG